MKSYKKIVTFICMLTLATVGVAQRDYSKSKGLLEYVDPYIGAGFHGHVFVGTSTPHGMVQLGPSNIHKGWDWCSAYHYSDSILIGFAHTHLNGTGCTDLSDILIMPMTEVRTKHGDQKDISNGYASKYSHENEVVRPEYYSLWIDRYNIKAELTTTDRVGFHRYTYPDGKNASILIDLHEGNGINAQEGYIHKIDDYTVEGYQYVDGWNKHRKLYFVLKSNQKIEEFTTYDSDEPQPFEQLRAKSVKGVLTFGNAREVQLKVALSPVSCNNAAKNMKAELPHWDFDKVVDNNSKRWNKELDRVHIVDDDWQGKRTFYTAYYHTLIAPTLFCDVNGEFRGGDEMIYTDPGKANYSTFSTWDTYRALHPLMTILQPDYVVPVINSMLSIYDQQGKLPVWYLMNGETNTMPGYNSVPIVADAYLKGFKGINGNRVLEAMKATAINKHQTGIPYILDKGYIPADKMHEATSYAMEYAIADWGIAQVAKKLGKMEEYELFAKRSRYYQQYFDKSIGFIRPRMDDGSWRTPYDPAQSIHSTGDFCEGNGWQYTFLAPHDPYGLIQQFGSDKPFCNRLDELFTNNDSMGNRASSGDLTGRIGQYAHGNEPSHHATYLYVYAGEQWKTAEKVRYIMDEFYTDKPDGIIGNEDCGQMSAWYILSSMGFYQVNPSSGVFVFGSPRFGEMEIRTVGNKKFTIIAENNSKENIYIQKVYLNGKEYNKTYIRYSDIIKGGVLKFVMDKKPNRTFGKEMDSRPIELDE